LDPSHTSYLVQDIPLFEIPTFNNPYHRINFLGITMLPQLEGKGLLFGTTASCGLGFMLFGIN